MIWWNLTSEQILLGIFLFSFSIFTTIGNALVIIAVIRERYLHTATNYFVTSLALADLLVGIVVMPFSAIYEVLEKRWLFELDWCDVWHSLDVLFSTASILNLCVISLDRYWAIKDPLSYPMRMTRKYAVILITIIWLASSLISFPAILWWRIDRTDTILKNKCPFTVNLEYIVFSSIVSFYFPLFVMVFTYYKIYREAEVQTRSLRIGAKQVIIASSQLQLTLRMHRGKDFTPKPRNHLYPDMSLPEKKNSLQLQNTFEKSSTTTVEKLFDFDYFNKNNTLAYNKNFSISRKLAKFSKEKKAAKTLGIVMGVFIICWLPFFIVNLISGFCTRCIWKEEIIFTAVSWLGWMNSGMNPIIYACWSKDFKRAFRKLLCPNRVQKSSRRHKNAFKDKTGKNLQDAATI
uniref:G-protein coupled receptors family 1 profile domain-containing protein n=1 Tax=Trichogramma kaykai TaxID=54128 RepID=A0ABD2W5Q1_9HYME